MTASDDRPILLEARDVVVHYGRIKALHGVSLVVHEGELVTLLGSNGAGKTTMMRAISGLRRLTSGSVWFDGRDITGVKAHKRVTDGLIQAPEGRGVFPGMTVTENLEMGCYGRKFASKAEHNERLDWVMETFPRLAERKNQVGGTLSGGEQQMLAIGRALMARPKVLLLDEPSMGLSPKLVETILGVLQRLKGQGLSMLLVEQNAKLTFEATSTCLVMEHGEVAMSGTSAELTHDARVRQIYLGL
jgi:branched-chain amino acid transport system ATP-binding protein